LCSPENWRQREIVVLQERLNMEIKRQATAVPRIDAADDRRRRARRC
jgi:hypothetical protein